MDFGGLTLSEEDALKAQIFGCWSIPLGLPFNEALLVRINVTIGTRWLYYKNRNS